MATHSHSKEAHIKAVDKYNKKTYKLIPVRFKIEDDADILKTFEQSDSSYRQLIREWYDTAHARKP